MPAPVDRPPAHRPRRRLLPSGHRRTAGLAALALAVAVGTAGCSTDPAVRDAAAAPSTQTAPPAAEPAAAHDAMPVSPPVRLRIPSIGVDSDLMALGLRGDGSLEVPPEGFPAGWYTGAPTPGELGPAIIAGHVDWNGQPGVFYGLRDLKPGADVSVDRADGSTAVFRVRSVQRFPKDAFPTEAVYADIDHPGLRLITCGGSFDKEAHSYRDNLVAFAELLGAGAP
ncbi:MAG: secreted protein [Blastococcus sp.]|nr:secreted protein [Blastococcus sp.]